MGSWEEWEEETEQQPRRSRIEEEWLWKRLEECDRKQAQDEKYEALKKEQETAKARKRMKAGKEQPSIRDKMVKISHKRVQPVEGGHCQGVCQRESSQVDNPSRVEDMPRAVNQEDIDNDISITSRMPGQTEQGVEVYKSVCDDMVAPVRENISIFEDEEPVSLAQLLRNDRIIE